MYNDIVVALYFGIAVGLLAYTFGRWRAIRNLICALACIFAIFHNALLIVNVSAVYWLGGPLTYQWVLTADPAWNGTSMLMLSSVVTAKLVIGVLLAILLPFALVVLARRESIASRLGKPVILTLITGACALLLLSSRPFVGDRWRDATTNPLVEISSSYMSDATHALLAGPTDGMIGDYVVQKGSAPLRSPSEPTRPDLLVVVLESVRGKTVKDHLFELPTLRRLTASGIDYPNASVSVPTSLRTMFSLVFSRYPYFGNKPESQALAGGYPEPFLRTLRRSGYQTNFILGGDFAYQRSDAMLVHNDAGATQDNSNIPCTDRWNLSSERFQSNIYLPDRCTYDAAEQWFLHTSGPKAAIVWPEATHFPYLLEGTDPSSADGSINTYLAAVKRSDALLGRMLLKLSNVGIHPVVLVIGDHGEQFGEHGFYAHSQTVHQEEINIPFILSGPGVAAGRRDPRLVNVVDIAPTLLDLARIKRPAGWQGISVLGSRRRGQDYSFALTRKPQVSMRTETRKYIQYLRTDNLVSYDLKADPGELVPRMVTGAESERIRKSIATWAQYNASLYRF